MASGDKIYIADKATLDEVRDKIGSTADTGGSSSVGTVMAKENAVLVEVGKIGATNDAQSSSTTTGSIFAKLNYLVYQISTYLSSIYSWVNKIGATTDTGATTTTGTVLGKENAILTEVNKIGNTTDITENTLFGKFKADLNSTIGTTNHKPLNEVVLEGTELMLDKVKAIRPPKDIIKTFISSPYMVPNNTTYSKIIGSFNVDEGLPSTDVSIYCTLRGGSSTAYPCYLWVTTISVPSLSATLQNSNIFNGSVSATSTVAQILTGNFVAQQNTTYYIHILPYSTYMMQCDECHINYDSAPLVKNIITSQVIANKTEVLLGSFDFKDVADGIPINVKFRCSVKTSDNYAIISVRSASGALLGYSLATLNIISATYSILEATLKLNNKETYYVSLLGYINAIAYCNSCSIIYEEDKLGISQIRSIQKGTVFMTNRSTVIIPISPVIPEKCAIIIHGYCTSVSSSIGENTITLKEESSYGGFTEWQLIEHL